MLLVRNRMVLLNVVLALILIAVGPYLSSPSAQAAEKRVLRGAAAADLRFALDEIVEAFHQQHSYINVRITYGSSGNFYAQLSSRAPFAVFFSADVDYPRRLVREGLAPADTEFMYGVGRT